MSIPTMPPLRPVATLMPFSASLKWRKLTSPVRLVGKVTSRYPCPVVTAWVDMETGEILPDTVAAKRPDYCKPIHTSERQLQREYVLSRLRPEVRAFAQFVLKFRNRRRGITPECDTLCKWYAKLTGKRASDVRRYLRALEGARILDGRALVGSLWQLAGRSLSPGEHTQEDKRAEALFQVMLMDSQAIPEHSEPPNWWPEGRTTEDTQAHLVALAAVPRTPAVAASA